MLETHAVIVKLDGTEALVEADQAGGCGQCNSVNGCGSGKLAKLFCARPRHFRVHNQIGAEVGDEVRVSVADGELFRSAFIVYIFPLLMLFAGGILGSVVAGAHNPDVYAAVGALAGLAAGFMLVRIFTPQQRILISALSPQHTSCDNESGKRLPGTLKAQDQGVIKC